jgi:hypothetical protein
MSEWHVEFQLTTKPLGFAGFIMRSEIGREATG